MKQLKSNLPLIGIAAFTLLLYAGINYLILGKAQLCIWRAICGFPCPGCGLTHAGIYLLSGNIRESLRWHPLLVPTVLTLGITSIPHGWCKWADRFKNMKTVFIVLLVLSFLLFLGRIIFLYPQSPFAGPMYYDPCNYFEVIKGLLFKNV